MARAKKKQSKQLVLVVHGLGEQGPGETLDALAGGLWGERDDVRVSSNMRVMQENHQPDPRKLRTFPCHIRRYSDPKTPNKPHTTFAEVYWADLSQADHGALRIFYGLIKTILGLGHIVRAGAKQYFGENTWSSRIANLVPYLLHGPVAAANAALATGVIFLFAATKLFAENKDKLPEPVMLMDDGTGWTLLLTGLFLCAVGCLWSRKSDVYYFRIFLVWLAVFGVAMVALAILELSGFGYDDIKNIAVKALLGDDVKPGKFTHGFLWYGAFLLLCLKIAWIAAMLAIGFTAVLTIIRLKKGDDAESPRPIKSIPPLVLIIPCAMTWLWMLVVATIWVSVNKSGIFEAQLNQDLLVEGVAQLLVALIGAGLVTVGVTLTLVKRRTWKEQYEKALPDINAVFAKSPVPRLLLSTGLKYGLLITGFLLVASAVLVILQFLEGDTVGLQIFGVDTVSGWIDKSKDSYLHIAIAIAAAIGGAAFTQKERIAQALGVGKDLITYFKVEPIEIGKKFYDDTAKKKGAFSSPKKFDFNNFRQRRRIHCRMQKVLNAMWQSDSFDELIVISHSQGTIIATEFAKELQKTNGSLIDEDAREALGPVMKEATLVTMGSPFTHIYNYYLPSEFGGPQTLVPGETIKEWINIFRVDDFIGTYIGDADLSGRWPKNLAVPPGGHTGYWKDEAVIYHLQPLFN